MGDVEVVGQQVRAEPCRQVGALLVVAVGIAGHLNVDVRHAIRRLTPPTLLVWGEQAVETPVEDSLGFRALKRDMVPLILDPAGMLPHDECAAEFNAGVVKFLEGVASTE